MIFDFPCKTVVLMTPDRGLWRHWFARLFCGLLVAGLLAPAANAAGKIELPPGPNRDLVYGTCQACHDLQYVKESAGVPRESWDELLDSMREYGLRIPPDRRTKILDYLGTYLGPNPPAAPAPEVAATEDEGADGAELFAEQCSACHQPNGIGVPGQYPPLAANPDLMRDKLLPAYVLLNGIKGEIAVLGKTYEAEMPAFDHLSDAEIAALVEYIRGAWGNAAFRPADLQPLDAASVAAARAKPMTPDEVHDYRAQLP